MRTKPAPTLDEVNERTNARIVARCSNEAVQVGEDGETSTPAPCAIGEVYRVASLTFSNVHGGTELVAVNASVRVQARWWDYETGWHFAGIVEALGAKAVSSFNGEVLTVPKCVRFTEHEMRPQRRG